MIDSVNCGIKAVELFFPLRNASNRLDKLVKDLDKEVSMDGCVSNPWPVMAKLGFSLFRSRWFSDALSD